MRYHRIFIHVKSEAIEVECGEEFGLQKDVYNKQQQQQQQSTAITTAATVKVDARNKSRTCIYIELRMRKILKPTKITMEIKIVAKLQI